MIFVTVGTHEQQFNRLIKEIDRLKGLGIIQDEVFIQIGFSDYVPSYCSYSKFLGYEEMEKYISNAEVVITHGGPASFMQVLKSGKIPIVVPRKYEFDEHVNSHQVDFSIKVQESGYPIKVVENISDLEKFLHKEDSQITISSNTNDFCEKLEREILFLFK